ncbi:MAG TPA: hypothetical protein V6C97_05810, partial [Oculatellaceae cyanobacterium]
MGAGKSGFIFGDGIIGGSVTCAGAGAGAGVVVVVVVDAGGMSTVDDEEEGVFVAECEGVVCGDIIDEDMDDVGTAVTGGGVVGGGLGRGLTIWGGVGKICRSVRGGVLETLMVVGVGELVVVAVAVVVVVAVAV